MKTKDLIKLLSKLPQEASVFYIWDGEPRSQAQHVWLAQNGDVMLAGCDHGVYSEESRPVGASDNPFWRTPKKAML